MADLTAKFKLIDEMSDKMESIAESGEKVLSSWEKAGETANEAFGTAVSSVDGVATSIEDFGSAAEEAASKTDYWTEAIGSYDKGMMEAVYSTEELVEMGFKSQEALDAETEALDMCDRQATFLNEALEATNNIEKDLIKTQEEAEEAAKAIAEADGVSAETKEQLQRASENAAEALEELNAAQEAAQAAMEEYDRILMSGTEDLSELERAAETACHAAEDLAAANGKATDATEELGKAADEAGEEAEKAGKRAETSVQDIAQALAAAGITAKVKEIAEATYELVDAFSEAEKTIVNATGATGEALDGLENSMLKAWSGNDDDMADVAGAIGEINTRLGLTGDTLADVTGLFLDYADVTGQNVVSSVQNVTKIMNQWGVELGDVEGLMDDLTYAGQMSGIGVGSLSDALVTNRGILEQAGFSLKESIGLMAQMELQGVSTQVVITGLRTAINKAAAEGRDADEYIREAITSIENAETATDATAIAVDNFGSRAGVALASSIRSGQLSIDELSSSMDAADGAMKRTADAAESLDEKWQKATNNVNAAFTSAVEPAMTKLSEGGAAIMDGIGDFLNEHPVLTKAITAVGVGLGVAVVALSGFTIITKLIPMVVEFGVTLNAALGPIGWVAIGITAVTAAVTAFIAMADEAEGEVAGLTATSKEQYYQLQDLNEEYERACSEYGENSEEALRLKYQVDDLTEAYEANKQTLEEYLAEVEEIVSAQQELVSGYEDTITEINQEETGTLALIQKLEDLVEANDGTLASHEKIQAVIDQLNEDLPELALNYDDVVAGVDNYAEAMKKAAEAQAEQERQAERQATYVDLLKQQSVLEEEIAKAEANLAAEREAEGYAWNEMYQTYMTRGGVAEEGLWTKWTTDIWEYKDSLDTLNASYAENEALLAEIEAEWNAQAAATEEAEAATVSYEDAVSSAINSAQEELTELCEAYDAAYTAARDSIDSQIGLFDTMKTECETSVADMQAALESQAEYLATYTENLKLAAQYGIDEGLIASLSDGSTESAGYIDAIVTQIQSLTDETGAMTEEAAQFVSDFNTSFQEVETAKDEFATTVAEMETDFSAKLDEMNAALNQSIDDMNMETEAAAAAKATMDSYIAQINSQKSAAVTAAQSLASATAAALNTSANVTVNVRRGYASGTLDAAPGIALVGENGPELVNFGGGEVVYTAEETQKVLANSYNTSKPLTLESMRQQTKEPTPGGESDRKITLDINGKGSLSVGGGVDKDTVIDMLYDYIKPVLANILEQEIYEEGALSYDY